jgi:methionine-rich copper-binding protein CopC
MLSASPSLVKLVFNVEPQGLVPEQSFFWIFNEQGLTVMALGQVDLSNADRNTMIANLPALNPGVYRVKWVAVSKADQGFAEGDYSFAVK